MAANTDYTHTEVVTADRIVIAVYHDPRRSYSRSVLPRAKREVQRILRGTSGTWTRTDVDFDRPHVIGNAVTAVTYERQS